MLFNVDAPQEIVGQFTAVERSVVVFWTSVHCVVCRMASGRSSAVRRRCGADTRQRADSAYSHLLRRVPQDTQSRHHRAHGSHFRY